MSSYVVTGASRGIGLEFVKQLSADNKNTVFAIVRNRATATNLTDLSTNNVTVLEADVTDAKTLKLAAAEVSKATGGKLEVLICNAGKSNLPGFTLDQFPSAEALEHDLLDNFKSNTISVVHSINAFLPLLKNGSTKKVITISSGLADPEFTILGEITAQGAYSISKAALNMVVAKYAAQFKAEGFIFLALCPGSVDTSPTAVSPRSAGAVEEYKMLFEAIPKVAPHFKGPITPEESVRMQLEVINRWTVKDTGAFVSHFGNKQWL
ncbi:hypothetical protein B0H19DRAFT_1381357 [Mycena capillaripes]|nr:hypothetical protein B0H19DRAFT_1381357 [Mycena capillaripes]